MTKEAHKRSHIVWSHLYKICRKGKLVETKISRFLGLRGKGRWQWQTCGFFLGWWKCSKPRLWENLWFVDYISIIQLKKKKDYTLIRMAQIKNSDRQYQVLTKIRSNSFSYIAQWYVHYKRVCGVEWRIWGNNLKKSGYMHNWFTLLYSRN